MSRNPVDPKVIDTEAVKTVRTDDFDMEFEDTSIDEGLKKAVIWPAVELQVEGEDKPVVKNDMVPVFYLTEDEH
ncbi:hypothetical protein TWF970_011524 [Orbilia oligospora]|uniref:Uncharacterized protein n=1 Tax=Orbilia oligospora TaxID=2813651 RepID=A0A7C8RF48_ORBOL|nr:hypothetical protein TWF970_011524 [Orbilia oligospora]